VLLAGLFVIGAVVKNRKKRLAALEPAFVPENVIESELTADTAALEPAAPEPPATEPTASQTIVPEQITPQQPAEPEEKKSEDGNAEGQV